MFPVKYLEKKLRCVGINLFLKPFLPKDPVKCQMMKVFIFGAFLSKNFSEKNVLFLLFSSKLKIWVEVRIFFFR